MTQESIQLKHLLGEYSEITNVAYAMQMIDGALDLLKAAKEALERNKKEK